MNYLYLLVFNDKKHFKIGISTNNFNRVHLHNLTYGINEHESIIIKSNKKNITILEKLLLAITPQLNESVFNGKDGYTEIRHIEYFEQCIQCINSYIETLNLRIAKYTSIKPKPIKAKQIKSNVLNPLSNTYNKIIDLINSDYSVSSKSNDYVYFVKNGYLDIDINEYKSILKSDCTTSSFGITSISYNKVKDISEIGISFDFKNKDQMERLNYDSDTIIKYINLKGLILKYAEAFCYETINITATK